MTRIYTKTGDQGQTGLIGGLRVGKDSRRVRAYGEVDELNAALGFVRSQLPPGEPADPLLDRIQCELFELGAELADPASKPRLGADRVRRLETEIDAMTASLPELKRFILPGGTAAGAALHVARGVCRRAERELTALAREEKPAPEALVYLNRLSDHLFTLARAVNARAGRPETPWTPDPRGG
jgi:cob(I)alamin adenosyltransferase